MSKINKEKKQDKKKIIDADGKVLGKINIIDLIILVLILLVISGSIYKFNAHEINIMRDQKEINYKIKIKDIKSSSAEFFKIGDEIFESKTKIYLGEIKNIIVNDYYDYIFDMHGELHKSKKPDRIELLLEIKSHGIENNNAYLINGSYELKIGADIYILSKYIDMTGNIYEIEK